MSRDMGARAPEHAYPRSVELRQLKYFVAIADARSFTTAAKTLMVTQPTLTMAMKKLEGELNTRLFHQGERGHQLTETGQLLYEEGTRILAEVGALEERIRDWGVEHPQNLRIGLTVLFSMQLMDRLALFMATHRDVELTIIQDGSLALQRRLAEGDIDVGILSFPKTAKEIEIQPLTGPHSSYRVAVVVRVDNPLADRPRLTFTDLAGQRFSSFPPRFVLGNMLAERCQHAGFSPDVAFVNDDWDVLLTSVKSLGSVCLIPSEFENFSRHEGLVWIPLEDKANNFPIGIATRKGAEITPALDEFVEILRRP